MSPLRSSATLLALSWSFWLVGPAEARAQGWVLDVMAGQTTHELATASAPTAGLVLGLRQGEASWFYLTGGVPFADADVPWAALGTGSRLLLDRAAVSVGIDVAGHAHGYRDGSSGTSGAGAVVEAMPLLVLHGGPLRLEARSGVQHYASSFGGESFSRRVHASDARLTLTRSRVRVAGEGRYVRAEEGSYPYLGGSVETSLGQVALWGYAGRWLTEQIDAPAWGVGGTVRINDRLEVQTAFHQESVEPLYLNTPRTSWSIGVSRTLGRARRALLPTAGVQPVVEGQRVTFRLPVSSAAEPPAVLGDFSGWNPVPMSRDGAFWTASLPVRSGVYAYVFRRADGKWIVPDGVPTRDDGFGGTSAVLIVP